MWDAMIGYTREHPNSEMLTVPIYMGFSVPTTVRGL